MIELNLNLVIFYVPCGNKKEAERIARSLLQKKMIACANIFPIKSMYWWKGKITNASEVVLLLKTTRKNSVKVRKEVQKLHSYTIPCILQFSAEANAAYARWTEEQIC